MESQDMVKMGEIYWLREEGVVIWGDKFYESHAILQIDLIKDLLVEMQDQYESSKEILPHDYPTLVQSEEKDS